MTEQVPSKERSRPERDQYPLDMAGDLQFNRALCSWQYDEIERLRRKKANLFAALGSKQARIDALMLEFCPGEMSVEQLAEFDEHQQPAHEPAQAHEDAIERIYQWADAYPLDVFPEPDLKRSAEVLKAAGLSLDRISAGAMRHVITKVKEIAVAALGRTPQPPEAE